MGSGKYKGWFSHPTEIPGAHRQAGRAHRPGCRERGPKKKKKIAWQNSGINVSEGGAVSFTLLQSWRSGRGQSKNSSMLNGCIFSIILFQGQRVLSAFALKYFICVVKRVKREWKWSVNQWTFYTSYMDLLVTVTHHNFCRAVLYTYQAYWCF